MLGFIDQNPNNMKKGLAFLTLTGIIFLFSYCTRDQKSISDEKMSEAFALMETNCFTCHSPDASEESRLAPPMEAVKRHYMEEEPTKEQFITTFVAFLQDPKAENSKMPGAVNRFGVMPKMEFSEEQLLQVATYVFDTKLEQPDWFEEHYQEERKKYQKKGQGNQKSYLERGKNYSLATKAILGKNLLTAINTEGPAYAVEFCNTQAIPLTDSMGLAQNVRITRVSDRPRNPDNQAHEAALNYIQTAKALLQNGEQIQGQIQNRNGKKIGYYPIVTNEMCLKCHGDPDKDIKPETLAKIKKLYPGDQATGYKTDQLRGIWVLEMDKKS